MALRTLHLGVGGRGKWPVNLFPTRDDVQPVGLCDIRARHLATACEITGLGDEVCYEDWREALEKVDCDVVVVITPPQLHFEMCLAAVQAGRHVMVEKPFTMDLAEACEVVREADAHHVRLAVCQNARYSPGNWTAMDLVAGGELGRARFGLQTKAGHRGGVHHSGVQRHSYAWERGIHDLDTVLSIFQELPRTVIAREFNPPWSPYRHGAGMHAVLEFESGATCCLSCNFMGWRGGDEWRVDCDGGTLLIEGRQVRLRRPGAAEDEVIEGGERPHAEAELTDGFVAWIHGAEEPVFGMHENLQVVALVETLGVASDERREVDIQAYLAERR